MTFDPPFYAVRALAGIERSGSPILAATACLGVAPTEADDFDATDAPAGSDAKIEELRRRVQLGMPLWHSSDRCDYTGLTGAVRPRE